MGDQVLRYASCAAWALLLVACSVGTGCGGDRAIDLEGQDQYWAIWNIEVPTSVRAKPMTSCQPGVAAEVDYFSAPVLSPDDKSCCYGQIILKQMRNRSCATARRVAWRVVCGLSRFLARTIS
jgi:hypothetical protein